MKPKVSKFPTMRVYLIFTEDCIEIYNISLSSFKMDVAELENC